MSGPFAGSEPRRDPLLPNAWIVAKREYRDRVTSRLFYVSTIFLAALAMLVAFSPLFVRIVDRGRATTIAVAAEDPALVERSKVIMSNVLNTVAGGGRVDAFRFVDAPIGEDLETAVAEGRYDGAIVAVRDASGRIDFTFLTGPGIGQDRATLVGIGALAVGVLDWTDNQRRPSDCGEGDPRPACQPFQVPGLSVIAQGGPNTGGAPLQGSEIANRTIVGVVFDFLLFLTLVIYGMWVAAGVVAEKTSRVMELLISAASPRQLVLGKVVGIGLAGLTQYIGILIPALVVLAVEDQVSVMLFGPAGAIAPSLGALTPALLLAFGLFFVLGFLLYSLIYAAAGSLVSRQEDLQMIALPLAVIAMVGYLIALMALLGSGSSVTRLASYVPFWSPFVMLTRLTVGRVEPWELVLTFALLIAAIAIVAVIAVRVYAAGVLLYGQRPGLRAIVGAIARPV